MLKEILFQWPDGTLQNKLTKENHRNMLDKDPTNTYMFWPQLDPLLIPLNT